MDIWNLSFGIRRMFGNWKLVIIASAAMLFCTQHNYHPKLVEYLRAEKELRKRVTEEQGLNDSINVLRQKYDIDLEKEFSRIKDNPEAWIELFKELKDEKQKD